MGESDNDNSSKYVGFDIVFGGLQLSRKMRVLDGWTARRLVSDGGWAVHLLAQ